MSAVAWAGAMPIVLQLSDPHLLAEPGARKRCVPTRRTFEQVLARAQRELPTIDRVVLSGDLADDEALATYEALRAVLGPHADGALALPGNHDDRGSLRACFEYGRAGHETSVRFLDDLSGWCLVGLDSQITGENPGRIGGDQLRWLADVLAARPRQPTVVFVHHCPIPTGRAKMDSMGLLDADALQAVLERAPGVRAVCCGHIHRALEGQLGAVPVYAAPSTAFQFPGPGDEGDYALLPPGCRVLHLEPEGLRTEVLRLPTLEYVPRRKG